jgi:hypothetical protein
MTPEVAVKKAIKKVFKERGIWACTPIGTGYGTGGVPDFICCWNGRLLAVEAKAPGKRNNTTALQKFQINAIRAAGGTALVVDDVNQLLEVLDAVVY